MWQQASSSPPFSASRMRLAGFTTMSATPAGSVRWPSRKSASVVQPLRLTSPRYADSTSATMHGTSPAAAARKVSGASATVAFIRIPLVLTEQFAHAADRFDEAVDL